MDRVTFREVTEYDYEAVMQIRQPEDIYNGIDYLPDYYTMILKAPGYKGYAAEIDGKLVAFEFACLLDDGTTFFSRAHRVSKEYSGKGIMSMLSNHVFNSLSNSNVLCSSATYDKERYYQAIEAKVLEGTVHLVHKKDIYSYEILSEHLKNILKKTIIPAGVEDVSREDLQRIFKSDKLCRYLFPENRVVTDWVPFKRVNSNIPHIFTDRCSVYGTNLTEDASGSENSLITFGYFFNIKPKSAIMYQLDVYGSNVNILHGHIIAHLKQFINLSCGKLILCLYCYDNVNKQECDGIAAKLGFRMKEIVFYKQVFCTDVLHKDMRQ